MRVKHKQFSASFLALTLVIGVTLTVRAEETSNNARINELVSICEGPTPKEMPEIKYELEKQPPRLIPAALRTRLRRKIFLSQEEFREFR
jgi:hypothetical protein